MSNRLEDLHSQYKRYRLKQWLKVFGAAVILFLLFGLGGYLLIEGLNEPPQKTSLSASKMEVKKTASKKQEKPKIELKKREDSPSYTLSVSEDALESSIKNIEEKKVLETVEKTVIQKPKPVVAKPTEVKEYKNYFDEVEQEKSRDVWIEKYNQKKSYALAISIAKQYYSDKEFKQAGIWAKRANQLDRNKEEAWLFYAKSVYALGNVTKAIRILNIYLQYKDSSKAELLLSEWSR